MKMFVFLIVVFQVFKHDKQKQCKYHVSHAILVHKWTHFTRALSRPVTFLGRPGMLSLWWLASNISNSVRVIMGCEPYILYLDMGYSLHIFTTMGYYGWWNVIYQHWPCVTKFKHAANIFFRWPGTPKMFLLKISKNSQDERKPTKVNKPVAGDGDAIADQLETKWIWSGWVVSPRIATFRTIWVWFGHEKHPKLSNTGVRVKTLL